MVALWIYVGNITTCVTTCDINSSSGSISISSVSIGISSGICSISSGSCSSSCSSGCIDTDLCIAVSTYQRRRYLNIVVLVVVLVLKFEHVSSISI
jgi:hypothetical protein